MGLVVDKCCGNSEHMPQRHLDYPTHRPRKHPLTYVNSLNNDNTMAYVIPARAL